MPTKTPDDPELEELLNELSRCAEQVAVATRKANAAAAAGVPAPAIIELRSAVELANSKRRAAKSALRAFMYKRTGEAYERALEDSR